MLLCCTVRDREPQHLADYLNNERHCIYVIKSSFSHLFIVSYIHLTTICVEINVKVSCCIMHVTASPHPATWAKAVPFFTRDRTVLSFTQLFHHGRDSVGRSRCGQIFHHLSVKTPLLVSCRTAERSDSDLHTHFAVIMLTDAPITQFCPPLLLFEPS